MYNWTTEHIINKVNTDDIVIEGGVLRYKKKLAIKLDAVDAWKRLGHYGRKASLTINSANVRLTPSSDCEGLMLSIKLGQKGKYDSEFQNALTRGAKNIDIEGATLADLCKGLAKWKNTTGSSLFEVALTKDSTTGVVTEAILTSNDHYLDIKEATVSEILATDLPGFSKYGASVEVANKIDVINPFGTSDWILHNLRFPSLENTRWKGVHEDERPIPGAVYDQYTIRVANDRGEVSGAGTVGHQLTSITTHVFYVLHSEATAFEGVFTNKVSFAQIKKTTSTVGDTNDENESIASSDTHIEFDTNKAQLETEETAGIPDGAEAPASTSSSDANTGDSNTEDPTV